MKPIIMKIVSRRICLLLATLISLSACEDHRDSPNADFPDRISFVADRQYPEGIAYSAQLAKFVVSSVTQGKIGTVSSTGQYADLLSDPALISGIGVKVDKGRILVANGDLGVSDKSTPATAFKLAEVLVFDLSTRQLLNRIRLDGLLPGVAHFVNDLTVDAQDNIYVTDSFAPVIYKITPAGGASILVSDARFAPPAGGFGLNGIVYHPDGYLVVAQTAAGKLYKVDLQNANTVSEVAGTGALSCDGLTLVGKTDLYVVTNNGSEVAQVASTDGWRNASVVKRDQSGYAGATTNVYVNGSIYTLNARINEIVTTLSTGTSPALLQSREYSLQKFR